MCHPVIRLIEETQNMTATAIHTRALLVWLNIRTWSARKYDKAVTQRVNSAEHASDDAGRYNKNLLPGDTASYKTLVTLAGSIRAEHYAHTLAWSDEGWRLLPTANYMAYTEWLRERRGAFDAALADFVSAYPALRQSAALRLNGLYRDEDYPRDSDVASRFALSIDYAPVPAQGDIRVNLADDQIASVEQAIAARTDDKVKAAVNDAWTRLHGVVARIAERLSQPDAIFRDTLIENATDICGSLQRLNVTDDPGLEAMRVRVLDELTRYSPEAIRTMPQVRVSTADRAQAILDSMRSVYGVTA
jgi:hypothetical protein